LDRRFLSDGLWIAEEGGIGDRMKKCTWCGKEYPDDATACSLDLQPLVCVAPPPTAPSEAQSGNHEALARRRSLGFRELTRLQNLWDFVFGVALIGGAPIAACWLVSALTTHFVDPSSTGYLPRLALASQAAFASGVVVLVLACLWRSKHRLLPSSIFVVEVLVALLVGGVYFLVLVAAGYAAYRAD